MNTSAAPAGAWLTAAGAGLLGGTALQLQQPALWPVAGYQALVGVACVLVIIALIAALFAGARSAERAEAASGPWALIRWLGHFVVWAALAWGATGWRASDRLADDLPTALEGVDLVVVGVIAGVPQRSPEAWRFRFEVESARRDDQTVRLPPLLSLGWFADERAPVLPSLRPGQRWQLVVRLKRPHGVQNPHGFDYELLLFEQGVRATGSVRPVPAANLRLLAEGVAHPVDRARQAVRDAIFSRVAASTDDPSRQQAAGLLAALSVGDQAAIDRDDWALYRQTGVAHLMSISGLHVTMFAWLAGGVCGALWRRSSRLALWCPAPSAARWGGLAAALAYAVFAGWGVPAQRTVLMLATVTLLGAAGLRWRWPMVWAAAMVVVVAIDPWALLQPGFWLSFAAVGLLMASGVAHQRPTVAARQGRAPTDGAAASPAGAGAPGDRWVAESSELAWLRWAGGGSWLARGRAVTVEALRTQVIATLGLAPLTLVFFQQLSVVGFVANLLAIPLVTLLITPLALLGALLPPLWSVAAWLAQGLNAGLQALAAPAWAVWSVPVAPAWAVASALLGAALGLMPLPWRLRVLAVPLVLPLLAPVVTRPAPGQFELTAIDVGQGTAVLVRTATHSLLYDAGPQYSREADAGERVIVPLLRALGLGRLDLLMLSHRDTDHVGGAAAVLQSLPVAELSSSLESGHRLRELAALQGAAVTACQAGQRWQWDGVSFEVLHPSADALARADEVKTKPNTLSCVLRIHTTAGALPQSVLLAGDLEREQELALVAQHGPALRSDVLIVPHHGSKTSSSAALLDAVAPRLAIVQAGYRNRFGHPAAPVVARYAERGIPVIDSPACGAWQWGFDASRPQADRCWRAAQRRYWHHPDIRAPENGVEVANPPGEATATDPAVP